MPNAKMPNAKMPNDPFAEFAKYVREQEEQEGKPLVRKPTAKELARMRALKLPASVIELFTRFAPINGFPHWFPLTLPLKGLLDEHEQDAFGLRAAGWFHFGDADDGDLFCFGDTVEPGACTPVVYLVDHEQICGSESPTPDDIRAAARRISRDVVDLVRAA